MVTNARRMSRAGGHRVTNLLARHRTSAHVEGNGEQKSDNSVPAGRTYRDKNILQILQGDAGEFSLFVDLENMGTTFQHQLKNGHGKPEKIVNDTYSGVVPVEDQCSLDPWCVLSMLGGELVGRTPEKSQTLPHLVIIESSGLADKHVCQLPH